MAPRNATGILESGFHKQCKSTSKLVAMDSYCYILAFLEICLLYVAAVVVGEFVSYLPQVVRILIEKCTERKSTFHIEIPTFLGQLIGGMIIVNVPGRLTRHIPLLLSVYLRNICMSIVLTRAGLGLDLNSLKVVGGTTLSLASIPCVLEALVVAGLCKWFRPSVPWAFCFCMGFVQSANSPTVIVPNIVSLQDGGYGVAKGIPTMILAACSLDILITVTAIGICVSTSFAELESTSGGSNTLVVSIASLLVSIVVGICFGYVMGHLHIQLTKWASTNYSVQSDRNATCSASQPSKIKQFFRSPPCRATLLVCCSVGITIVAVSFGYESASYLCTMTMSMVASQGWNEIQKAQDKAHSKAQERGEKENEVFDYRTNLVSSEIRALFVHCQPLLLCLIGAAVVIADVEPGDVTTALAIISISVLFRIIITYFSVSAPSSGLTHNEMMFVAVSWFTKATAQAVFGPIVLDTASAMDDDVNQPTGENYGKLILTTAIISVIFTAPIGAIAIPMMGTNLLERTPVDNPPESDNILVAAATIVVRSISSIGAPRDSFAQQFNDFKFRSSLWSNHSGNHGAGSNSNRNSYTNIGNLNRNSDTNSNTAHHVDSALINDVRCALLGDVDSDEIDGNCA